MGWATAISSGLQLASGLFGAHQQRKAADAGKQASQQSIAAWQGARDQAQGYQQPYREIGQAGLSGLQGIANGQYGQAFDSPFFKARVNFANDQFNNGAAAKFRLFSGGAQNDRDALNQNLASEGIRDYTNFNMGLAGMGQQAAGASAAYGLTAANGITDGLQGIAGAAQQRAGANAGLGYGLAGLASNAFGQFGGGGASTGSAYSTPGSTNQFGMPAFNSGYGGQFGSGSWY
jgi:hypothetical protein